MARQAPSSTSSAAARSTPAPSRIARLAFRTATGEFRAISSAMPTAVADRLAGGDDAVDDAERGGLLGVQAASGVDQLRGAGDADPPGQQLGAAEPGDDPDGDLRQADHGGGVGDDQVAEQGELQPAAQGMPRHGGHDRNGDRQQRVSHAPVHDPLGTQLGVAVAVALLEVRPHAEGARTARRQDERPERVVLAERGEDLRELGG